MPPKAKGKKKGGYQMPEQFKAGFVLKDVYKKPWCLGTPIGQGGFGLIYIANRGESQLKNSDEAEYVVKIEPKENGPLFSEIHFYTNCAKEEDLKKFMSTKNLKHLAMPKYISSGICVYNEKEYRFLVMDRYSTDLQRILGRPEADLRLPSETGILCLMRQILWSLEYIHQRGYAHGDIKGANLMLKNDEHSYLVDYGLAYRFKRDNIHQKFEIKPDRRHNGTIEYTSRDAHDGAQISRRSDLEILGYCVIHWSCGKLPWVELIKNPVHVQESKKKSMGNVKEFLSKTLESVDGLSSTFIKFMEFYLNEVNKLQFDTEPDYMKIHNKITDTLTQLGHSKNSKDNFNIFSKEQKKATSSKSKIVIEKRQETVEFNDSLLDKNKRVAKTGGLAPKSNKRVKKKNKLEEELIKSSEDESDNDVIVEKESIEEKSSKKARTLPKMFEDSYELEKSPEPAKKSPLVKMKPRRIKKISNLVQSPQMSDSPISPRGTPRRAAYKAASNLVFSKDEPDESETENKKENENDVYSKNLDSKLTSVSKFLRNELNLMEKDLDKSINQIKPVLVKKKKNKISRTISTQTENSYLQNIRNKIAF